jgi:hypothetical protein
MPRIAVAIPSICGSISVMDREPMQHDGWNDPVDVRPYNARLILRKWAADPDNRAIRARYACDRCHAFSIRV